MFSDPVLNFGDSPILAKSSVEVPLVLLDVAIEKDLPFVADLFKKEVAPAGELDASMIGFAEMFASFRGSNTSYAFMLWLGKIPLFEIELHLADKQDLLRKDFPPENTDYNISLMTGNFGHAEFSAYVLGFQLCLDYFWSLPDVKRIIAPVYAGTHEKEQTRLFTESGLQLSLKRVEPRDPELYILSRPL
ncbi:MAG: hypothetical protein ABUM51_07220 [Bacteroidota bacterium]